MAEAADTATAPAGQASEAPGNACFLANMRALWRRDPRLALRLDAVDDEQRLVLEPSRKGPFTARATLPNGTPAYLHSRYDPEAEAVKFIDGFDLEEKFCLVVVGMGLGYHVRELGNRLRGDAFILCVEPSLERLASALCCVDLSDLVEKGKLLFLVDEDKTRLHEVLHNRNTLMMLGAQFIRHAPSLRLGQAGYTAICNLITEFVTFARMSLMTLVANSKITCRNIANNLVHYVSTPPIDILRDRFAGNPAVIVAAGPSLHKNIDLLAELKGKAVLCAVQTTLRPLLQRGIVPDFATSLDFHEMSQKFFEGLEGLENIHLVAEPKATWHVLDKYPGPISILENHWAKQLIGEELGCRSGLKAGATVAHLAFYLAAYMGCNPIIFVGQDLAFSNHVFYVPGVEIHQTWQSELHRFSTMEMKEWDRIARNGNILRRVPGADGTTLYTDELLFTYLEQFEKDISATPAQVIDATEGGARIRGTEVTTLREVMDRYASAPIDPQRFAYRDKVSWRNEQMVEAATAEVRQRLAELDEAAGVCDALLPILEELKDLTHDPATFNRKLVKVDELRARVSQKSRSYRIINSATQMAEFRRYTADRRIGMGEPEDESDRAILQLERDIDFVTGVREGADIVREYLGEGLDRLESAQKGKR